MISLRFLGAAGTVTGSKHALTVDEEKVLVDCGLFQGLKELRQRNWEPLAEPADSFGALLLTHAHIDHSGYIPALVNQGFRGPIFCTPPTRDLCELLLLDAAKLQKEEADYRNRHNLSSHHPARPLYTESEAFACLQQFQTVDYGSPFQVVPGVEATFHDAGHILGSAWIELQLTPRSGEPLKLVMSGDLGREQAPILRDPEPLVPCDFVVAECTYGDRSHTDEPIGPRLAEVIRETVARKGELVIPAFAVERAQELMYLIGQLYDERHMARIPVFLDSPMAASATRLFERYRGYYDQAAREHTLLTGELLNYRKLQICDTIAESKKIARTPPPLIVISASGMATGGRVLHHLQRTLPDPKNTVLLVGFQAEGTRGWRLQNGEPFLRIFHEDVPVRASVKFLDGFSGHADFRQINRWLQAPGTPPRRVFLVHGEPASLQAQKERICRWPGWDAYAPAMGETVVLQS